MTTNVMTETPTIKFSGPFTVRMVTASTGNTTSRTIAWKALPFAARTASRLADRGIVHSIEVLDRHGNDVTFASDILPLLEEITVIPADKPTQPAVAEWVNAHG
mgnify:CR=1 FL=1